MKININKLSNTTINIEEFNEKLTLYSRLNIFNISLLSSCGIPLKISSEKLEKLSRKTSKITEDTLSLNINLNPTTAVFLSSSSLLKSNDLRSFNESSFDKIISLPCQGYSVLCDVKMAKQLCTEAFSLDANTELCSRKISLALMLFKTAQEKIKFTCAHLRDIDGMFVSKKLNNKSDITALKHVNTCSDIEDNAIFLNSLIETAKTLDNIKYPIFKNKKLSNTINEYIHDILEFIFSEYRNIINKDVSTLSSIINVLCSYYEYTYNFVEEKKCYNMILKCSIELISRMSILDKLCNSRDPGDLCDVTSNFMAITSLANSFMVTGMDPFKDCALKIFDSIEFMWNDDYRIYYGQNKDSKSKIYCDELAVIINSLYMISTIDKVSREKAINRMLTIFESYFINMYMQLSTYCPDFYKYMPELKTDDYDNFNGHAPLICSHLKIKPNKKSIYIEDEEVNIERALKACNIFLDTAKL